jgi:hypothetical protein
MSEIIIVPIGATDANPPGPVTILELRGNFSGNSEMLSFHV